MKKTLSNHRESLKNNHIFQTEAGQRHLVINSHLRFILFPMLYSVNVVGVYLKHNDFIYAFYNSINHSLRILKLEKLV